MASHEESAQKRVKNEEFSDDDETPLSKAPRRNPDKNGGGLKMSKKCPYLDTIDRTVLDFGKEYTMRSRIITSFNSGFIFVFLKSFEGQHFPKS